MRRCRNKFRAVRSSWVNNMINPFRRAEAPRPPEEDSLMAELNEIIKEDDAILAGEHKKNPEGMGTERTELLAYADTMVGRGDLHLPKEITHVRKKPRSQKEQTYGLEKSEHALVLRYAPQYLDEGGENIVYEIPDRPNVVVKASKLGIYEALAHDSELPAADSVELSDQLREMNKLLGKEGAYSQARKKLYEYFGREHVPPQKRFLIKVPVNKEILDVTEKTFGPWYGIKIPKDRKEAWTFVTVQRKQELHEENYVSANIGNLEPSMAQGGMFKDKKYRDAVNRMNNALIWGQEDVTAEEIAFVIRTDGIQNLKERLESDPELKEALKDFAEKAIAYANDTGEILDIVGKDNVVFVKEGGKWTYKLLDPIYSFQDKILEKSRQIYIDKPQDDLEGNVLFQGRNFVRGLNAFAKLAGSEKRIEFLPVALKRDTGYF